MIWRQTPQGGVQLFGIDDDGDLLKACFAARDAFPDGDAFGADR